VAITIAAAAGLQLAVYCFRRSRAFYAASPDASRPARRAATLDYRATPKIAL